MKPSEWIKRRVAEIEKDDSLLYKAGGPAGVFDMAIMDYLDMVHGDKKQPEGEQE